MMALPRSGAWTFLGLLIGCAVLSLAAQVQAKMIVGRVVKVSNGDTIVVIDHAQQPHRIRMRAVDAPESGQPFGRRSRESLAGLVGGRAVRVRADSSDRYGRDLGIVYLGDLDINQVQLERGMAWWYRSHAGEQTARDRVDYRRAEQTARARRLGVWSSPRPVPPWIWRREHPAPHGGFRSASAG